MEPDSPGEKAGLQAGDKILEVDGKPVTRFSGMNDSVIWNVIRSEGDTIPFRRRTQRAARLSFSVVPYKAPTQRLAAQERAAGADLSRDHADHRSGAAEDSPAAAAGLQHGDIIQGFNGNADVQPDRAGGLISRQHPHGDH